MKIIIAIPCLLLGGSEVATLQMLKALLSVGYQVICVCYYDIDPLMLERYQKTGAEVILLRQKRNGIKGLFVLLGQLIRLFREQKPAAVHVQYFAPGMIPLLAARIAGVKHVFATIHAAGERGYNYKAKLMFRMSAMLTTHFFCVAENTERFWFGTVGGIRHSTIHNGIDIEGFAHAAPAQMPEIDLVSDFVIGIVGRVVKIKGHDCLFHAAKSLLPKFANLKILIIGDGEYRTELEKLGRQLELTERIIWCGRIEPENLPGYYKAMTILTMPSHWEGFGMTAAEAMAAGIPVAVSDVPGLREVVGDSGIIFPVNDTVQLALSIEKLRDFKIRQQYSQRGQKRVSRLFGLEEQMKRWQTAYAALIKAQ